MSPFWLGVCLGLLIGLFCGLACPMQWSITVLPTRVASRRTRP